MTYYGLLAQFDGQAVSVYERKMKYTIKGLYANNIILINALLTTIEKRCILAEELGHHYTSFGDILDQKHLSHRKQEVTARNWAYHYLFPLQKIIEAYQYGITNRSEFAEYLDVTEEFLNEALERYREKYGLCVTYNGYTICFDPLDVIPTFE